MFSHQIPVIITKNYPVSVSPCTDGVFDSVAGVSYSSTLLFFLSFFSFHQTDTLYCFALLHTCCHCDVNFLKMSLETWRVIWDQSHTGEEKGLDPVLIKLQLFSLRQRPELIWIWTAFPFTDFPYTAADEIPSQTSFFLRNAKNFTTVDI